MSVPKILVGTPTHDSKFYCLTEWINNIKLIDYPNFDVLLVDNSKGDDYKKRIESLGVKCIKGPIFKDSNKTLCESRKILFDYALKNNYDYVLSVEQDIFPPKNIIKRLLAFNKDVVGAWYLLGQYNDNQFRRKIDWVSSCTDLEKEITLPDGNKCRFWFLKSEVEKKKGLIQVANCGFGCVLIKSDVLKRVKPRIIVGLKRYDDYYFFEDCLKEKIKVYVDTSTFVQHFPSLGGGSGWLKL